MAFKHDEMKTKGYITGCTCNNNLGNFNNSGSLSNDWLVLYYEFKNKSNSNSQYMVTTYSGYASKVKQHIISRYNSNSALSSKELEIFLSPDKFKLSELKEYAAKYKLDSSNLPTKKALISVIK
jgi:hypothetical protein